jgi:hypothetical protein
MKAKRKPANRALVSTGRRGSFRSSQGSESGADTFKLQWLTIQSSGRGRAMLAPRHHASVRMRGADSRFAIPN